MNFVAKLQAIAAALQEILSLSPQVQTELTSLNSFLDAL